MSNASDVICFDCGCTLRWTGQSMYICKCGTAYQIDIDYVDAAGLCVDPFLTSKALVDASLRCPDTRTIKRIGL